MFRTSFASTLLPGLAWSLISLITAMPISSAITDVTSGSVRCSSGLSVVDEYQGSVPLSVYGGQVMVVVPRASSVYGADARFAEVEVQEVFDPTSHVRTCEMMKVVASATCSVDRSKSRRFEFLFHCPTFTHDRVQQVLFALRFLFIHITS